MFMADKFVYNITMKTTSMTSLANLPARDRILLTAHDLFYRDGIRATGINRVIAESGVTKVTFYRHFPSKNDLIREFLEYRHQRWISWFADALRRHGGNLQAMTPTLREWFSNPGYRGCAFINSVGELGGELPEVTDIARRHKSDMIGLVAALIPSPEQRDLDAQALALAVDGAIFRSQIDPTPDAALLAFDRLLRALAARQTDGQTVREPSDMPTRAVK